MAGGKYEAVWNKLIGEKHLFSMENRAFNAISIISAIVLVYSLAFDIYIGQAVMSTVILVLLLALCCLYYYSRVKQKYKGGLVIYAFCSYAAMIANYYLNSGLEGPTLLYFCLTFLLLIGISPRRLYRLWIGLHCGIAIALCYSEYHWPNTVKGSYSNGFDHFLDILAGYFAIIIFGYFITNYLRKYYHEERLLSEQRLQEIIAQNEQIKLHNELLAKANEEKNKLFSIVSHDLRTPIDSIAGYLNLLSENIVDSDERQEIELELLSQTKYTSDLLLNLLYWSKTQMNGVRPNLAPVGLAEVVDDARNFKIAAAARKGIKLTYNIDKDVEVIADKDMLRIVLRNVINNALKFTKPGGEVVIRLNRKGTLGEVAIQDNGIGIHVEKQKEIFTLKSDSTYGTKDEKGIGLGLMLCKEFMNYQKGDITFESKIGQGSVFYIALPLACAN